MAGKISEYSSTRTAFAGLDLFDVSATDDAGSTYVSQKTTWTNIKAQLTSELSFLSAGDNVSALINDAGYVTSNITHAGEVTGAATLALHQTAISNKTLVTAVATDMVLLWDATDSTLKRADVSDFLGGGGNTIYTADDTIGAGRVATLTDKLTLKGLTDGNDAFIINNDLSQERFKVNTDGTVTIATKLHAGVTGVPFTTNHELEDLDDATALSVFGVHQNLAIMSSSPFGGGTTGSGIGFGAEYTAGGTQTTLAFIDAVKENTTSGNFQGKLRLIARDQANNGNVGLEVYSTGNVAINEASGSEPLHVSGNARVDGAIGVDVAPTYQMQILESGGYASATKSGFLYGNSGLTDVAGLTATGFSTFVHPKFIGRADGTAGRALFFEAQTLAANDVAPTDHATALFMFNGTRRETLTSGASGVDNMRLASFNSTSAGESRFEIMSKGNVRIWTLSSNSHYTIEGLNTNAFEVYGNNTTDVVFSGFTTTGAGQKNNSLLLNLRGRYWDGAATQNFNGTIQNIVDTTDTATPLGRMVFALHGNTGIVINEDGSVDMDNLPTSNPGGTGKIWNNSGVLNIT